MINTLRLAKLPNSIYVQFMDYVATLVTNNDAAVLNVKPQHDLFLQKLDELKNIYKSAQASSLSEKIIKADNLRDQILIGIIKIVEANGFHYVKDMKATAKVLQKNIKLYGTKITKDDYQTETAKIESIVNDWRTKPELTPAMTALQLNGWITELENANNEFKRLYALRTEEYSQKTHENMKSKRVEVNMAYNELCNFLNSYSVTNRSNPAYEAVISGINSYVDQYVTLMRQKKGHKPEDPTQN